MATIKQIIVVLLLLPLSMQAQKSNFNIYQLMERRDLNIKEVDALAKDYFDKRGTGKGSGYKQFQRWWYEQKFHLDKNGNFISPQSVGYYRLQIVEQDGKAYYSKIVSIDRQKFKLGIRQLFPNPVEKALNLDFDAAQKGNVSIVVRDLLGRIVMSQLIDSQEGSNKLSLDVSSLSNATYYLFVSDGKNQVMEKFVKQ